MTIYRYESAWTHFYSHNKRKLIKTLEEHCEFLSDETQQEVTPPTPDKIKTLDHLELAWFYPMSINMWYKMEVSPEVTFHFSVGAYREMVRQIFKPLLKAGDISLVQNSHVHTTGIQDRIFQCARRKLADTQKPYIDIGCGMRRTPDFEYIKEKGIVEFVR